MITELKVFSADIFFVHVSPGSLDVPPHADETGEPSHIK